MKKKPKNLKTQKRLINTNLFEKLSTTMSAIGQSGGFSLPMMQKMQELTAKYTSLSTAPNVFNMGRDNQPNEQMPVQLGTTDPEDQKWALREKIIAQQPAGAAAANEIVGIGKALAPEGYFDYAQRKEMNDLMVQYQQFILQQVDLSKPESQQWWYSKFPWIRDLKLSEMRAQADLQKRYAEIQITGPQNEEDFMLLWMRRNGLIKVAEVPPERLYEARNILATSYQDGFFSPLAKAIPATSVRNTGILPWSNPVSQDPATDNGPVRTSTFTRIPGQATFANILTAPRGGPFIIPGAPAAAQ